MIRYSDVLLMYAEAVVMGGKATANITPLEAINRVRDRAGVPHIADANMETIENERILELTYEGFRFLIYFVGEKWWNVSVSWKLPILCLRSLAELSIWVSRKTRMSGFRCLSMK